MVSASLETRIGRRFDRPELLERALTHASAGEGRPIDTYERLEFLGDRVLAILIAETLYAAHPDAPESRLALWLNALVKKSACARAARRAGLGADIRLSKAEAASGGRDKETILGDVCEAVIGALYLDGGLDPARAFVARYWAQEIEAVDAVGRDAKTALQEWAAGEGLATPLYRVAERAGPDHAPVFTVEVRVEGFAPAVGEGASKRAAETAAAAAFLEARGHV